MQNLIHNYEKDSWLFNLVTAIANPRKQKETAVDFNPSCGVTLMGYSQTAHTYTLRFNISGKSERFSTDNHETFAKIIAINKYQNADDAYIFACNNTEAV